MTELISATFIHSNSSLDGSMYPWLPKQLVPEAQVQQDYMRDHQFKGTPMEQLCEIAGRACYDSAGRGRVTEEFHKHILEVGHLSVIEHATFTVRIGNLNEERLRAVLIDCLNKPSMHIAGSASLEGGELRHGLEITCNLRHVLEWDKQETWTGTLLRKYAHELAPQIVGPAPGPLSDPEWADTLVTPKLPEQHWLTFFLTCSRGCSHELVRHGDNTAISQRSTRYVDESESPWVTHPIEQIVTDHEVAQFAAAGSESNEILVKKMGLKGEQYAKGTYSLLVEKIQDYLTKKGVDKTTARKQARGAARGHLGNALYTEVVFSASVKQWLWMIKQRANPAADAEIREVFVQVVEQVQKPMFKDEPWAKFFADIKLEPSPDGIGRIAIVP